MTGEPLLQPGDSSEWVTYLQRALLLVGIDPAPQETGTYDDATVASVRSVRSTMGLAESDATDDEVWAALLTPSVVADLDAQYSGGTAEATEGYTSTDPSDVTLLFICPVEVEGRDMFTFNVQAGAWADVPAGTFEMKQWIMYADGTYEEDGTMPLAHDIPRGQQHHIRQVIDPKREVAEGDKITMLWDFQGKTNERLRAIFTKGERRSWTVDDSSIDYL